MFCRIVFLVIALSVVLDLVCIGIYAGFRLYIRIKRHSNGFKAESWVKKYENNNH